MLSATLNKSASAAEALAKNIKSLSEDDKEKLKNGKMSIRSLIPKEKESTKQPDTKANEKSKEKTKTEEFALAREHIKTIGIAIKELEEISLIGGDSKNSKKIQNAIRTVIENLEQLLAKESPELVQEEQAIKDNATS